MRKLNSRWESLFIETWFAPFPLTVSWDRSGYISDSIDHLSIRSEQLAHYIHVYDSFSFRRSF
ncbi:uncharacterized protein F4812DRAFT_427697 [Daldinia caldariorum]|uniref:uncharacterized protein n=1 Tax=Daldinia caldariorum TaxID=326644 RepID=UPI002008493E|nr:uncharacterized protein F4812DRAFT_427697 [Daldinia caldariorum]KAI1467820.1 hypothetical protein F4812DRAFT_427697 [Daldinia caldariorum]